MSHISLTTHSTPNDVIVYWFGPEALQDPETLDSVAYIEDRMGLWFAGKSPNFDSVQKNAALLVEHVSNENSLNTQWHSPLGVIARVILLDQFTRCIYRGTARAFQYDLLTAQLISKAVDEGILQSLRPIHRFFLGVALQHSEDIKMQKVGVDIANSVAAGTTDELKEYFRNIKGYPMEHHDVILRFGRFPSRNAALVSLLLLTSSEMQFMFFCLQENAYCSVTPISFYLC